MAFIPVENVVGVEMRYSWNDEPVENTLYFHNDSGWSPANLQTLGEALMEWWFQELRPFQASTCIMREIYIRDLTTETGWNGTYTPADPGNGTATGESLPNNCTLVISFRTGRVGRSYRGRNYAVGLVEAFALNTYATPVYAAAMVTAYQNMETYLSLTPFAHVVVSRYTNNAPRVTGLAQTVTAYLVTDLAMDSQRRRLPGRGQ